MSNKVKIIIISESDPASRVAASKVRQDVEFSLQESKMVVIDLQQVISMAKSYGDELFGVLAQDLGLSEFIKCVGLKNAHPVVKRQIAECIKTRLNSDTLGDEVAQLLNARTNLN